MAMLNNQMVYPIIIPSMAMQQEPIDWRYLASIFGLYSWNSHWHWDMFGIWCTFWGSEIVRILGEVFFWGGGHLMMRNPILRFGRFPRHFQTPFFFSTHETYWCLAGNFREWCTITSNNHPSNPQQPIHSLRLAPVRKCSHFPQDAAPKKAFSCLISGWINSGLW